MSGVEVRLEGPGFDSFISAIDQLVTAGTGPVLVGGLAVMSRLGVQHRVTLDVDSTFDRPEDPTTTELLVAQGIGVAAVDGPNTERVRVDDTIVDVIDTFEIDETQLPDDPKDRLFACAHRYAWETGGPMSFIGHSAQTELAVATVDALIAMKSHALRFGSRERRHKKRGSDLHDLVRLSTATNGPLLAGAPWRLAAQVHEALAVDLARYDDVGATLRISGGTGVDRFTADTVELFVERLLGRLDA